MPFTPDQIEGRSYEAESDAFIQAYGCTPRDVTRSPADFSDEVVSVAEFLDAWDVWLFSEEAEA